MYMCNLTGNINIEVGLKDPMYAKDLLSREIETV